MKLKRYTLLPSGFSRGVWLSAVAAILANLLVACGSGMQSTGSQLSTEESPKSVLLVISGGFNSCLKNSSRRYDPREMTMYQQILAQSKTLTDSRYANSDVIASCYTRKIIGAGEEVHFTHSSQPDQIIVEPRSNFLQSVKGFAAEKNYSDILIFGHSYGGWTVMQIVTKLSQAKINVTYLATIDPISPTTCTPGNIIQSDQPGEVGYSGCKRAPSDLSESQLAQISDATSLWQNYYQQNYSRLHSSEIQSADANFNKDYGDARGNAHSKIAADESVWEQVFTAISQNIGSNDDHRDSDTNSQDTNRDDLNLNAISQLGAKIKFAIGSADDEKFHSFITAPDAVENVSLCKGNTATCTKSLEAFIEFDSGLNFNGHSGFKSLEKLLPDSGQAYTILGFDSENTLIAAQSIAFERR